MTPIPTVDTEYQPAHLLEVLESLVFVHVMRHDDGPADGRHHAGEGQGIGHCHGNLHGLRVPPLDRGRRDGDVRYKEHAQGYLCGLRN